MKTLILELFYVIGFCRYPVLATMEQNRIQKKMGLQGRGEQQGLMKSLSLSILNETMTLIVKPHYKPS